MGESGEDKAGSKAVTFARAWNDESITAPLGFRSHLSREELMGLVSGQIVGPGNLKTVLSGKDPGIGRLFARGCES